MRNTDPYAVLQMGAMTLTRLKDAHAIFKNLVVDARRSGGGGGGGGEGGKGAGAKEEAGDGGGGEAAAAAGEVAALREKVKQRDQEIAILVNMVKQAKAGRPFTGDSSASSQPGGVRSLRCCWLLVVLVATCGLSQAIRSCFGRGSRS